MEIVLFAGQEKKKKAITIYAGLPYINNEQPD